MSARRLSSASYLQASGHPQSLFVLGRSTLKLVYHPSSFPCSNRTFTSSSSSGGGNSGGDASPPTPPPSPPPVERKPHLKQPSSPRVVLKKYVSGQSFDATKPWEPKDAKDIVKKPLWDRVKDEAKHYWHGTKQLARNFSIVWRLRMKQLRGGRLARRDTLELRRNARDSGKLIPFAVIAVVPFLEFALPIILKVFPNFMPSTYTTEHERNQKYRKTQEERVKLFSILFDTVVRIGEHHFGDLEDEEFQAVWSRFKSREAITREEFESVFKVIGPYMRFEDLDLDTLKALCSYVGISSAIGFHPLILIRRLNKFMTFIQKDDKLIAEAGAYVGIIRMFDTEVRQAGHERGLKVIGASSEELRRDLFFWVQMSLSQEYVSTALLYFAAFRVHGKIVPRRTPVASSPLVPSYYRKFTDATEGQQ
eukprot:TRINITY_DN10724_c0_g1_i1.p1 TRINITY_DN10724_c0_g1~~TRINITY_DN10724_c0_g1_i1.p1  ORF type:complete len:439 (-),score=94.48 TRINITY_DN10724_c0_g1_i1:26-1291(-)